MKKVLKPQVMFTMLIIINVKMPTIMTIVRIVGILTFISMLNTTSESLKACHAQLSMIFYITWPVSNKIRCIRELVPSGPVCSLIRI